MLVRPRRLPNGDSTGAHSIPHTAIHDACLILTGSHKNPGRLYRDRACLQEAAEDHLSAGTFFYMLNTADTTYPIFQTFDRWVPPARADIPDHWFPPGWPRNLPADERPAWQDVVDARVLNSRTALSGIAKGLDCAGDTGGCAVSGYQQPLKGSHIIPAAKNVWYIARRIYLQLPDQTVRPRSLAFENCIHDIRNFISHRIDIHKKWDNNDWVYIPYADAFVVYFLSCARDEYDHLFHWQRPRLPDRTDPYLLYVRFALAIFNCVSPNELEGHPASCDVLPAVSSNTKNESITPKAEKEGLPSSHLWVKAQRRRLMLRASPHLPMRNFI
ncbi:hypothetical protein C8R44DRAFT_867556 [Mycena epipterygia]|nr:hypothetical protein C8R44DRAFT_867556 [Mycena epipterygia]